MLALATNWSTISSLATGAGTLVLAVATFAAVRSSQRSARVAEAALQEQRRPVLANSRFDDPVQKAMFVEGKWVHAGGGRAVAELDDGRVFLAISLRNVGTGLAVCQAWFVSAGLRSLRTDPAHAPEEEFRLQTRDLYVAGGDTGIWQGAVRSHEDPAYAPLVHSIDNEEPITIELLYSDQVGGQRTISRFGLSPRTDPDTGERMWFANVSRHWFLDRASPRPESEALAARQATLLAEAELAEAAEAESSTAQSAGAR